MAMIADVNPSSPVDRAYLCGLLPVMRYTPKKEAVPLAGLTLVHPVSTPSILVTINAHIWAGLLTMLFALRYSSCLPRYSQFSCPKGCV